MEAEIIEKTIEISRAVAETMQETEDETMQETEDEDEMPVWLPGEKSWDRLGLTSHGFSEDAMQRFKDQAQRFRDEMKRFSPDTRQWIKDEMRRIEDRAQGKFDSPQ